MKRPALFCLFLILIATSVGYSQQPKGAASPEIDSGALSIVDALVARIKADDTEGLLKIARAQMHVPRLREEEFGRFRVRIAQDRVGHREAMGKPSAEVELVKSRVAGKSLAHLIYLEKYPMGAVLWYFTLYRGQDGWLLEDIRWNRDFLSLFVASP